jgi:predicted esterase
MIRKVTIIVTAVLLVFNIYAGAADMTYLNKNNTINDLMTHQAFKEFAPHLLPRQRDIDAGGTRLGNTGTLMPYHSNVDGNTVVAALNHMIDYAADGKIIFYDFYTGVQKQEDPGKNATGLFFFRGEPGAPFAVICPGGGFSYVGSFHEGFPYAMELSKKGYNAFVLQYRVGGGGGLATQDLAAALSYIFKNADTLDVSTKNYSLWGSSAGARMAAYIGSNGTVAFGGDNLPKPVAVVMAYTGHSEYTLNDPPTFAVVGENDGIASPAVMERRINAMKTAGIDAMIKKYPNLGHGFGLGIGTSAEGWISEAVRFWEKHIYRR